MAYEMRDNSGSLFRNSKRETDNHPNMTGSALIGNVEYWVSAWTKTGKSGEKWVSLSFKEKDQPAAAKHDEQKRNGYMPDDDVPF